MGSVYTEFLKLKRSMSWAVVLLLPIIMVSTGSMSSIAGGGQFDDGWHTLWIRSIGFYGMAILSVGIAILASLVWRVEHRGSNWNALMSRPVPTLQVVVGKTTAISALAAMMQLVFVVAVIVFGKTLGLSGMLPGQYLKCSRDPGMRTRRRAAIGTVLVLPLVCRPRRHRARPYRGVNDGTTGEDRGHIGPAPCGSHRRHTDRHHPRLG